VAHETGWGDGIYQYKNNEGDSETYVYEGLVRYIKGISDDADESINFPEGLFYEDEKLMYRKEKILIQFLQTPFTFIKALIHLYKDGKFAMKNAMGVLEKVLRLYG
jgi:hypothetical protein